MSVGLNRGTRRRVSLTQLSLIMGIVFLGRAGVEVAGISEWLVGTRDGGRWWHFGVSVRTILHKGLWIFPYLGARNPRPREACRTREVGGDGAIPCQSSASLIAYRCQVSSDPQPTPPTARTGVAVERGGTLGFAGCRRRRLLAVERRADRSEALGAAAVGQETEMANTHKPLGQDMEQEAAQEFHACEGHDLVATLVAIVLVIELHLILVEAEDPCIGQRDPMAVARQVIHHRLGVGETGLRVDHPLGGHKAVEHGADLRWLLDTRQLAVFQVPAQATDEAAAYMPRE